MKNKIKTILWRWAIRQLRLLTDSADEWIHAEEVKLRAPIAAPMKTVATNEFQIAARPRLRYQGGQFVRV